MARPGADPVTAAAAESRTAQFVVLLINPSDEPGAFRARVRCTPWVGEIPEQTTVAAAPDELRAAAQRWIDALLDIR